MSLCVRFLGTGGAVPSVQRNTSAVLVRREGERLLFDCGEGTQRQMMRFGTGFAVSHLFVSHLHGDHVLGIPGFLQTTGFNDRDAPIAIHVPNGKRRAMRNLLDGTATRPSFPVRIREVGPGDVAYRAAEFEVRAFATEHRTRSVGYALVEDDRKGRFDRERAEELGVSPGPLFSRLHEGEDVELDDGTVVRSEQVVGDPRPGRRFVYTGDTRPIDAIAEAADGADLLVHDATFTDDDADRAAHTGHSTAREAAEIASEAGAKRLALTHVSSRYAGHVTPLEEEAREVFAGQAFVPDDGDELDVPYPEN
jgi:ribonuclease Z